MLTFEQRQLFEEWSYTKQLISIAVRIKPHGFFGELKDFSKPADTVLVLFCNDASKEFITPRIREVFDLILMFDSSVTTLEGVESSAEITVPELTELAEKLKEIVDLKKLEIHYTCELSITAVCHVRKLLGLPGPYNEDLVHIRFKDRVFAHAAKHDIPTAKYATVDFSRLSLDDISDEVERIETAIGPGYPLFKRPTCMYGSVGAQPLESREDLIDWMTDRIQSGDTHMHLVEEYVVGREFLAVGLVTHEGIYCPLVVKYLEFGWSNVRYIETGRPITVFVDTLKQAEDEFPGLTEFVDKVVEVYKPPPSQMFCVQGFQLEPGEKDDNYLLVELTPRGTGPRTGSVIYQVCGVDQDSASLMSMIDIDYHPYVDPNRERHPELMLWFPQQPGLLKQYTDLPGKDKVKSEMKANWLHPPGTTFERTWDISSHILILTVRNTNRKQLLTDAKWIADNWRPKLEKVTYKSG